MREILGTIPALAKQGLFLAHSNSIYRYNHKQTIINVPQCSQGIVYLTYTIQLTVYHNDHLTTTHPTQNSAEVLLHPDTTKMALPVILNQNCHVASEYYGQKRLYSIEYGLIPQPSRIQDKTRR